MNYLRELSYIIQKVEVIQVKGKAISLNDAISELSCLILAHHENGNKVILFGNGGSASIASHVATDLIKSAEIPALTLSDTNLLTCLSNDLGYENAFQKFTEMFATEGDVVFAISSSGKSKNILNGAREAKTKGCHVITLSGFKENNPLRELGDMNFYVPSDSFGYVELIHSIICHWVTDDVIERKGRKI
jgi:D-sedoheptulose 7-phosphate isomerase